MQNLKVLPTIVDEIARVNEIVEAVGTPLIRIKYR